MSAPSKAEVVAALSRLPTLQLRRVFFEGLQNPRWVKPLMSVGAFGYPPAPTVDEKGYIRETFWPEIEYLTRMAALVPDDVVSVLLRLKESENSWVRRGAFEIARSIPVDSAARLEDLIKAWNPNFGFRTDPRDLTTLAQRLLTSRHARFGVSFANMLFRPRSRGKDSRDPLLTIEEYWYTGALPEIVEALGPSALAVVTPWLEKWEEFSGRVTATADFSSIARSDIGTRDDRYFDTEQALVEAVRDAAAREILIHPTETAKLLRKRPMILIRKIALYAAASAITASDGAPSAELLEASRGLLEEPQSGDGQCRIEFADLFALLHDHGVDANATLQKVLSAGPSGSRAELVERLRERNDEGADPEKLADEYEESWRQRILTTVGADYLPQLLADELAELDERLGPIDGIRSPDFKFQMWSGPTSPATVDELQELAPEELARYLETWHPSDAWMSPTHEGMGRVLSDLIATKPDALLGVEELVERIRPTYLRAMLQGWTTLLRSDVDLGLDWPHVLDVAEGVLHHPDKSEIPAEGRDIDDDADFRSAKQLAISLLTELARPSTKRPLPLEVSQRVAQLLIQNSEQDGESWTRYRSKNTTDGSDPLTTSLNWQWPILVRGLVSLVSQGSDTPWFRQAEEALDRELARNDELGASRAVIGEGLGRLYNGAPDWLRENAASIFGTEDSTSTSQQIALTTALATQHMHPALFELLRPSLVGAIRHTGSLQMGWIGGNAGGHQLVGQWIITSIIWGTIQPNDPIAEMFFEDVSPVVRGASLGHIAWSFLHSEKVDSEIRNRFENLWDSRVAHVREHPEDKEELSDFYWFVRSEKFEPQWWLPRLREAAELNPDLNTHGMIGEQLAASAMISPRDALSALRLLMARPDETGGASYDLSEHAAAPIIAAALDAGDETLAKDATEFMNKLGADGLVNLDRHVEALRVDRHPG